MDMTITFPGGKKVNAAFDAFTVRTDQPVPSGGEGSAPAPFDLFLASIGTCAGIYVAAFCQTRGIPTEGLHLVQHNEADPSTHRLVRVRIEIVLPPGFPEQYRDAVRRAAEGCAVKKAILSPPEFTIETRDGA